MLLKAPHLLGSRAIDRGIAGVQACDVDIGRTRARIVSDLFIEIELRGIDTLCIGPAVLSRSTGTSEPAYSTIRASCKMRKPRSVMRSTAPGPAPMKRSEEHTSELQSPDHL